MKKLIVFLLFLLTVTVAASGAFAAIVVGRIAHVEGEIYRYMDVDDSWVGTFLQSPAGTEDLLATGANSKAEIIFPNDQVVRLDGGTEIGIQNLDDEIGEFQLHSGLARFHNRNSAGRLFVETFMGTARVEPGSAVDVMVGKNSVTVSAVHGETVFQAFENGIETIEVISGSTSLEFRGNNVIASAGPVDRSWDRWNMDREGVWTQNRYVRSEYLPESMQDYAYTMEPYGRWQRVYYRGYYYWAWKPHSVAYGWSPYSTGHWYDWHGTQVWIDNNPWGWVTHHHGHWINRHGSWLWTPYVHVSHVPGITVIGLNITFGRNYRPHWHPGRVRWIAYSDYIGWLPLAPWETYYGHRKWGPRTVVWHSGPGISININLSRHAYINHALVIPKRHLYGRKHGVVNNYNTVKIKNINKTVIINNYKPLQETERARRKEITAKTRRPQNSADRIETRLMGRKGKTGKAVQAESRQRPNERPVLAGKRENNRQYATARPEKRNRRNREIEHNGRAENNKEKVRRDTAQKRDYRPERSRQRNAERRNKEFPETLSAERVPSREKRLANETRRKLEKKELRQVERKTNSREKAVARREKAEVRKRSSDRQYIHTEQPGPGQRLARKTERAERREKKPRREKRPEEILQEDTGGNRKAGSLQNGHDRRGPGKNREYRQRSDRNWYSSLPGKNRIR